MLLRVKEEQNRATFRFSLNLRQANQFRERIQEMFVALQIAAF